MIKRLFLALLACALASCSTLPMSCRSLPSGHAIYVVEEGWHTDIGIPVDELGPRLAFYRAVFPGRGF